MSETVVMKTNSQPAPLLVWERGRWAYEGFVSEEALKEITNVMYTSHPYTLAYQINHIIKPRMDLVERNKDMPMFIRIVFKEGANAETIAAYCSYLSNIVLGNRI